MEDLLRFLLLLLERATRMIFILQKRHQTTVLKNDMNAVTM